MIMNTRTIPNLEPVLKSLHVQCSRPLAFEVFTARIHEWWPLDTHSVGQTAARSVVLEPAEGGRLYERCDDGTEHLWGTVTHWDPPCGFDCTWHPGRAPEQATRLKLRFDTEGRGTHVTLEHDGWEALGEQAEETRAGYDTGWENVFGAQYRDAAATMAAAG